MDHPQFRISEEDIRTKVVYTWLIDHGFNPSDISIEFSFEIRLGRGVYRVDGTSLQETSEKAAFRPRADVLVRTRNGRNLMIVEVKAPDESLNENVREQGISYARLLRDGGIAPFVVLTNGLETQIYDSLSGEIISDTHVPLDHPHVKAGFRINSDDLKLRAEALEIFISLSPNNLIEFCRRQTAYRMRRLRDDDPMSGKKYIPTLYIERRRAKETLENLINGEKRPVVVLTGPPQVGKTNFICHTVEEYLARGIPCLFFPAIGMQKGLLDEISEDFEWVFGESNSHYQLLHHKLKRVLQRVEQRLVVFIDGWNEADLTLARSIDFESERLSCNDIALVISMTNVAASRLLIDNVGNPSYIAEAASIKQSDISLIEITPERLIGNWSGVPLGKYTEDEVDKAYIRYAEIFNVKVPSSHQEVLDPFLLRIGMEHFSGQVLPTILDEPELMRNGLQTKASRTKDIDTNTVCTLLSELADEMFINSAPISQVSALKRWRRPLLDKFPDGLFEAALLAKTCDQGGQPSLDFYYGRERDFIVACWVRDWENKLGKSQESTIEELFLASQTQVGIDALRWFLGQSNYEEQLRLATESFDTCSSPIKRILLASTLKFLRRNGTEKEWLKNVMYKGVSEKDILVKAEAAKLMAEFTEDYEDLAGILSANEQLITNLLITEDDDPEPRIVGYVILNAFRDIHWNLAGTDDEGSELTDTLIKLLYHNSLNVRSGAAQALGYVAPDILLKSLSNWITTSRLQVSYKLMSIYIESINLALGQLQERYYGSICPGYLNVLRDEPESCLKEYIEMTDLCMPIITFYGKEKFSQEYLALLEDLQPIEHTTKLKDWSEALNEFEVETLVRIQNHLRYLDDDVRFMINDLLALRYQLPLPFQEADT